MARIKGLPGNDDLMGSMDGDVLLGRGGDDILWGGAGNDVLRGEDGFDVLRGEAGDDRLVGGRNADFLSGGDGNDTLVGDSGRKTARGADAAGDRLDGGAGEDLLVLGDGLETATGGSGSDAFFFKQNNPQTPLAVATGPAFTAITDFNAADDTLVFDAAGVGRDTAAANFVDLSGGGGPTSSFYSGAVAGAAGENVVVLTDQGFASGLLAVQTLQGEQAGDLVLYFNTTVGVASLLVVSAPDTAVSIARFTDVNSVEDLATAGFGASDFVFA